MPGTCRAFGLAATIGNRRTSRTSYWINECGCVSCDVDANLGQGLSGQVVDGGARLGASRVHLHGVTRDLAHQAGGHLRLSAVLDADEQHGLPRSPEGVATTMARRHQAPADDDGFVEELRAGRIEIVAAVVGFDQSDVLLTDGAHIQPGAVIAATGYRRGLDELVGHLGVLDSNGVPLVSGGQEHPSAAGLFFNGYRVDLSGQLRLMRIDARAIAKAVRCQRPPET